MRQSREAKAESHRTIVAKAAEMFRERGVEGTSVADVMGAARMTHGGFYKHFDSKEDLLAAAITAGFDGILERFDTEGGNAKDAVEAFVSMYLSRGHVEQPGAGCPIAALGAETSRLDGVASEATAEGIVRLVDKLAILLPGPKASARERALHLLATLVGAVVIARAAGETPVGRQVLEACRSRITA